jgi:hypothetical protein
MGDGLCHPTWCGRLRPRLPMPVDDRHSYISAQGQLRRYEAPCNKDVNVPGTSSFVSRL